MSYQKPQRSNFDLICGMILGGLLASVLSPIVSKNLAGEGPKKSLKARAPITHNIQSGPLDKVKEKTKIASANAEPARIAEKLDVKKASEGQGQGSKTDPKVEKPQAIVSSAIRSDIKKEPKKVEKPKPKIKAKTKQKSAEVLEEMQDSLSAQSIAQKTDSALTDTGASLVPANLAKEDAVVTILNAQFSKDQLQNCPKRCLLKSQDTKGNVIHAIINGPAFADVLKDHQGTINIIGVKRVVKNHEVLMVQNITFNLPSKGETAQAKTVKTPVQTGSQTGQWEDLSEDLKLR